MAIWSKALPLTVSCLTPRYLVRIPAGAYEKVVSDLGLGGVFPGYSGFLY